MCKSCLTRTQALSPADGAGRWVLSLDPAIFSHSTGTSVPSASVCVTVSGAHQRPRQPPKGAVGQLPGLQDTARGSNKGRLDVSYATSAFTEPARSTELCPLGGFRQDQPLSPSGGYESPGQVEAIPKEGHSHFHILELLLDSRQHAGLHFPAALAMR